MYAEHVEPRACSRGRQESKLIIIRIITGVLLSHLRDLAKVVHAPEVTFSDASIRPRRAPVFAACAPYSSALLELTIVATERLDLANIMQVYQLPRELYTHHIIVSQDHHAVGAVYCIYVLNSYCRYRHQVLIPFSHPTRMQVVRSPQYALIRQ